MKKTGNVCNPCCYPEIVNSQACGCCEGIDMLTPLARYNRPSLSEISYRIGSHASFLETMKARLSSSDYPALTGLTTRDTNDPSIALLDSWATIADVLTFYQERIANEGYLRTATERRSILELARLVGYKLRSGVSSSVFLAYTIDENTKEEVTIPSGSRVQSIPGPDELPQAFETSEDLQARAKWNNLKPRMVRPQTATMIKQEARVYLKGINSNLKPNDPLLIDFGTGTPAFHRVKTITPDAIADHTRVMLQVSAEVKDIQKEPLNTVQLIKALTLMPSLQPANTLRLSRKLDQQFMAKAATGYRTLSRFSTQLSETFTSAVANAQVTSASSLKVFALRIEASLFGHNAIREPQYEPATHIPSGGEFPIANPNGGNLKPQPWPEWKPDGEAKDVLYLDRVYEQIIQDDYIVVDKNNESPTVFESKNIRSVSRAAYGISGEITRITLNADWLDMNAQKNISKIRTTKIYAQPEQLELAEAPITDPIGRCVNRGNEAVTESTVTVELDGFYEDLQSGRWVVVSGEREIEGTLGVRFSELVMLASVTQDVREGFSEEKKHTFLKFANELAYCFKRDTVTLYGNVAKATHGETRQEVLGSGDGSKVLQSFELKQKPLTHVSASNPTGVDSTLNVFINDIRWHETDTLADKPSTERSFTTQTDHEDKTRIIFGNGKQGARLPTGIENIKAEYRAGIGTAGNVRAEQISLLQTKPLGVKEVINPLRASGGADREKRDQARKNAPLAIKALDRLVSVQDYEDFCRTYAGIGKARAIEISDGYRQRVHITIAGVDDIPLDPSSDLLQNLRHALHHFGDPYQAIALEVRELMLMVSNARVRILPDYQWEAVVTQIRDAMLETFSFAQRELGQDVLLSEVISVMQAVRGVAYVDVDTFGGIPEKIHVQGIRRLLTPDEIAESVDCLSTRGSHQVIKTEFEEFSSTSTNLEYEKYLACMKYGNVRKGGKTQAVRQRLSVNLAGMEAGLIRPAQLAFLTPDVAETLILNQIE